MHIYGYWKHNMHVQCTYISIIVSSSPKHFYIDIIRDDLNHMPYLTLCIKEAMRLYSPVPQIARMLTKPTEIEGVELLPDTVVFISFYAMHHNPLVWGDDHMEYNPDRFLPDNIDGMDPYAYCPFSAGPRYDEIILKKQFTMMGIKHNFS